MQALFFICSRLVYYKKVVNELHLLPFISPGKIGQSIATLIVYCCQDIMTSCILVFSVSVLFLQYAFQNDDYLFYVFAFAAGGMLFHHLVRVLCLCMLGVYQ